jgi:nucleotide-binding universal stress UspA family protein
MFKRILVPVDDSELSERAIQASLSLARQLGAAVTGFVAEPLPPLGSGPLPRSQMPHDTQEHETLTAEQAQLILQHFRACAQDAGVPFDAYHDQVPRISTAIIAAAEARGCDMIIMAAHGRGAFGEFLFGSETKAILAGCNLPLLVLR